MLRLSRVLFLLFAFTSAYQLLTSCSQTQPVKQVPAPVVRYWRVNDTLVLECSRPLVPLIITCDSTDSNRQMGRDTLWSRIALRGRKGYYQVLDEDDFYTLYSATTTPKGDVLTLALWADYPEQLARVRAHPHKSLVLCTNDFGFLTWDVKYRTGSMPVSSDLIWLPRKINTFEFNQERAKQRDDTTYDAGEEPDEFERKYRLLPYWIAQEQAYLARTHRLPVAKRLDAYIDLGLNPDIYTSAILAAPYRPLLAQLLQAYRAYPMPRATRHRLDQALNFLAIPPSGQGPKRTSSQPAAPRQVSN